MQHLEITKRNMTGVAVLDLVGEIQIGSTSDLYHKTLLHFSNSGQHQILLNFAQIKRIDANGLGEIVESLNNISAIGGTVKIVNPNREVLELLKVTKCESLVDIFENEAEALGSFEKFEQGNSSEKRSFVREPHFEKEDDDLGLPQHPLFSNYSKYLWKRKPTFRKTH